MNQTELPENGFEGDIDLGLVMGQNQAFGLVAGRCSAAQAACLRQIRDKKLYKKRCPDWDQFCREHLHMARSQVHHVIKLLNEFGPDYFELSQLTRVSPETYRAIQPALQDKTLHVEGEAIALIPENTARISAAVAKLRKASNPEASKPSQWTQLEALEKRSYAIVDELVELAGSQQMPHQISIFLTGLMARLSRLRSQL
ncbi:MAG TPA: hypothetical protein VKU19_38415 [Bryobacteraceae bacterium]|nr:hypothetical protein [Bryobacteraceae bacterium]